MLCLTYPVCLLLIKSIHTTMHTHSQVAKCMHTICTRTLLVRAFTHIPTQHNCTAFNALCSRKVATHCFSPEIPFNPVHKRHILEENTWHYNGWRHLMIAWVSHVTHVAWHGSSWRTRAQMPPGQVSSACVSCYPLGQFLPINPVRHRAMDWSATTLTE